jgi:hypothetical protein
MLNLSVTRQPLSERSYFAKKTYEATLSVEHVGVSNDEQRWLDLTFAIKPDGKHGSVFGLAISPSDFAELARMMVEVDPATAIHAFGAAMQSADIERRAPTKDAQAA